MSNQSHNISKIFNLITLGYFLSLGWFISYSPDEKAITSIVPEQDQKAVLAYLFDDLTNDDFSVFSLVAKINAGINEHNDLAKANEKWDEVIYADFASEIARISAKGALADHPLLFLNILLGLIALSTAIYLWSRITQPTTCSPMTSSATNRGVVGIITGVSLIAFYVVLYFQPAYLTAWILLMDPLKQLFAPDTTASQWFLYGFLYSLAVLIMGGRMILKYRHNRYQIFRTCSVIFFQLAIAFILPEVLVRLNQPYFDFKNMWPLDYDFFDAWHIKTLTSSGGVGVFMLAWGITLFVIGVPVFVYFFGKRWYCSWVCGCGGLAETAGDPYRHLSDKSLKAWKIERYLIYIILVWAVLMTIGMVYHLATGSYQIFGLDTYNYLRKPYGFLIGSIFSGVIGTGFYPLMGNRVWCRFGCPLAAYMGIIQRFKSRYRITSNGSQCISCGQCSTHCEMGIDVRWYAQRGQDISRASCVGCGICAEVCPRGVLKLENTTAPKKEAPNAMVGNESF